MSKNRAIFTTLLLFLSLALSLHSFAQAPKLKKVLFIGNSYTAVNDLPNWVRLVAESAGDTFEVVSIAPGGTTFSMHVNNPQVTSELASGNYDAVILQEQSQIPSFPQSQVESQCFPYAEALVDAARVGKPCVKVVFYMTWGRENGDAQNCATWPPVCKFGGMNELLRQRYVQMAKDNGCDVAPVGSVWREVRNKSSIGLYQGDGSHPSTAGTHLAALTIYRALTGKALDTAMFRGPIADVDHKLLVSQVNFIGKDSAFLWQYDTCYRKVAGLNKGIDRAMGHGITTRWEDGQSKLLIECASNPSMECTVVDALGRTMFRGSTIGSESASQNGHNWEISTENWPSGMYFLRSNCGGSLIWKN